VTQGVALGWLVAAPLVLKARNHFPPLSFALPVVLPG